jgi:carboxypeptidase D
VGLDVVDGDLRISSNYSSSGLPNATHTESFVALPFTTNSSLAASSSTAVTTAPV